MANTPHIGLHQWQPNDSFLREEFNQDFVKIDTAVGALQAAVPSVLLKKHTTTVAVQQVDISLADIRFEDYRKLEIDLIPPPASANVNAMVRFNERASSGDYSLRWFGGSGGLADYFAYLSFGPNSARVTLECTSSAVCGDYREIGVNGSMTLSYMSPSIGVTLSGLSRMNFLGHTKPIPVGTQITVYGVKR